jgi:hypothetical protein
MACATFHRTAEIRRAAPTPMMAPRDGARHQRLSVPLEQVEELVLSGKKFLKPVHHRKFSVLARCRNRQWRR